MRETVCCNCAGEMSSKWEVFRDMYCGEECFKADNWRNGNTLDPNQPIENIND